MKRIVTKVTNPFRGFKAEELLSFIQRIARRLENYAHELQESLVVDIYHDTEVIKKTTNNVQVHVKEIHQSISDVWDMSVQHEARMDSRIDELKDFCARQITCALESQNGLYQMLRDVVSGKYHAPVTNERIADPIELFNLVIQSWDKTTHGILRLEYRYPKGS
jgi:hypothetical protein